MLRAGRVDPRPLKTRGGKGVRTECHSSWIPFGEKEEGEREREKQGKGEIMENRVRDAGGRECSKREKSRRYEESV